MATSEYFPMLSSSSCRDSTTGERLSPPASSLPLTRSDRPAQVAEQRERDEQKWGSGSREQKRGAEKKKQRSRGAKDRRREEERDEQKIGAEREIVTISTVEPCLKR